MANCVVNSRPHFARNIILAESKQFRSSPLLVAANRYQQYYPRKHENMISEILDILANLSKLPPKKDKLEKSKNNNLIFICYLISAISLIFLIPELKKISLNKNSTIIITLIITVSIIFALVGIKLLQKLNLFEQQTFSKFITILISLILLFMISTCLIINNYYIRL